MRDAAAPPPDDGHDADDGDDAMLDDSCPPALAAALRRPPPRDLAARARLDAALATLPRPSRAGRALHLARWLVRPDAIRLPPLAAGAMAAGLVALGVLLDARPRDRAGAREPVAAVADLPDTVRMVRFVLVAPGAAQVALVGDFNAWDPARTPMRASSGAGVWTVELPVAAGRHVYAFVVDGTRWVADPAAPLAPEDGFGTRNSVLVVGAET